MITWDNYEEYILLHADGELDEAGERALMGFVAKHPELRAELDAYAVVKLTPDTSITFSAKESLMRPEEKPATRVISFGGWRQYSAAAGIILVLFLAAKWLMTDKTTIDRTPVVAGNGQVIVDSLQPVVKQEQVAKKETAAPVLEKETAVVPHQSIAKQQQPAQQKRIAKEEPINPTLQQAPVPTQQTPKPETIAATPTPVQPLPTINPNPTPQQALPQTPTNPQTTDNNKESRFLASLPVSEEKRAGLENLKENLSEKLAKAKSIRNNMKDVTIALKLGNKELRLF